jgi:tripartite-type tricarboxylate transporter receptor subunit TctC
MVRRGFDAWCRPAAAMALAVLVALLDRAPAQAQAAEDFYRGKQIKLVIGFGVGGSYDLYARVIARHIGRQLPGNPVVVPMNMPEAGSLAATNYLYNVAPRDGTVIATVAGGTPTAPLIFPDQAKFDAARLNWLGSADNAPNIDLVWHTTPVLSLDDLRKRDVVIGATGPGATTVDLPLLVNGVLGYRYRLIAGYQSLADIDLAMERGEVEGESGTSLYTVRTRHPDWLSEKKVRILAQYGRRKLAALPDVPLILDQAQSDEDRQALHFLLDRQEMAKPYVAPPGLPAERVRLLRRAFDATLKDPAFLAEADKLQLDITPMSGEEVQAMAVSLARTPPTIVARVRTLLSAKVR